jgi:putative ABC transport system permease protein
MSAQPSRVGTVLALAASDAVHDRRLFLCFALALAAVLAPLLIVFGLKHGVMDDMLAGLRNDPRNREIINVANRTIPPAWFADMAKRPEVGFVAPRTRTLSLMASVGTPADRLRGQRAELITSGPSDPLLGAAASSLAPDAFALSEALATRLRVKAGDGLVLWIVRQGEGGPQRFDIEARVASVVPSAVEQRAAVFAPLAVIADIEDSFDGRAVAHRGWAGNAPMADRPFAGFRLFAARIEDVGGLERELTEAGYEVRTAADRIAWVLGLDRNLNQLFAVIAACALLGFTVALAASLWANVERKRRELSILRLLGLGSGTLMVFPVAQAALVAAVGALLAFALFALAAGGINIAFANAYAADKPLCRIEAWHALAAALGTLCVALLAGAMAARQAARIEPAEGLRDA